MEELRPEDLEELVQEVEAEDGAEELLRPEVEDLLRVLHSDSTYLARRRAAEQLGEVSSSNRQAVRALLEAAESDPIADVRGAAVESLGAPVHQAILERCPELTRRAHTAVARQRKQAHAGETNYGRALALRAKRWGIVNAALCGLLVVATVASLVLGALGVGGAGEGMFFVLMLLFFIPIAFVPIGLSCLVGAVRSGVALRRHSSREARIGLWLSLGGPIALIACYALGFGIELLYPIVLLEVEPHMTVNEVRLTDGEGQNPAWSPDGSRIAFERDDDIYVMNADGSNVVCLTGGSADARAPAWSPDGTRIAFHSNRAGQYDWDIYVMDADGSNKVRLTQDGVDPAWSPDGSRIAFVGRGNDASGIHVMDADGSNIVRLTDGKSPTNPAWSPDGSRIAFEGYGEPSYPHIYVMDADGSDILRLTDGLIEGDPAWSPDGSRIAFTGCGQYDRHHIYVMDADGANVLRLTDGSSGERAPTWSPDGSRIAYVSDRGYASAIYVLEFEE